MLTDAKCRGAAAREKAYRIADAHGLCLEVRPTGAKYWLYRFRLAGRANTHRLGEYPRMGLRDARAARDAARDLVESGINPNHQRALERAARAADRGTTFEGVAGMWLARHAADWSPGYLRNVRARLEQDAYPEIGAYPISDLRPAHVLALLRTVEKRSPAQAKLLQTWVGGVFRFAVVEQLRDDDPTFPLRRAVKKSQVQHHAKLTDREIGPFLRALRDASGDVVVKSAATLMWLTACRVGEVTGARWDEIDIEHALWTIPAARMKGGQEHVVPLSRQVVELLQRMQAHSGTLAHVFPNRSDRRRHMSDEGVRDLFRRAGYEGRLSPHGVRGTFSTAANGARWDAEVIELCLAHQERDAIRAAYNAARLLPERRELLQWWADVSDAAQAGGTVVVFKRSA